MAATNGLTTADVPSQMRLSSGGFLAQVQPLQQRVPLRPESIDPRQLAGSLSFEQKMILRGNVATLHAWVRQHRAEGLDGAAPTVTAAFVAAIETIAEIGALTD